MHTITAPLWYTLQFGKAERLEVCDGAELATTRRSGLPENPALRQCLLELLHAFVGDLGVAEVQVYKVVQSFEVSQTSVSDLRAAASFK